MAGTILVPTPQGNVPMTLEQARAYYRAHPQEAVAPDIQTALQDPRLQQALASGGTTDLEIGGRRYTVTDGRLTGVRTGGSPWPKVAVAGATAAGGYGLGTLAGGGTGAAGTAGATGTGGSAAGVNPSLAADLALEAGASGSSAAAPSLGGRVASALLNKNVLASGIGAVGQLIGQHIASNASDKAAQIQADYLNKALDYEKERDAYLRNLESSRYGEIQNRLGPYLQLGSSAAERIQRLLGGGGGGALAGFMPTAGVEPPIQHVTLPGGPDLGVLPPQQPSGAPVLHTNPIPQRRV